MEQYQAADAALATSLDQVVPSSRDGQRTRPPWGAARGATPWATLVAYHVADCGGDDQVCAIEVHDLRRVIPTPLGPSRAWIFLGSGAKRIQLQTKSQQWSPLRQSRSTMLYPKRSSSASNASIRRRQRRQHLDRIHHHALRSESKRRLNQMRPLLEPC